VLGIERVTDDNFAGSISPTLLKMISIGNLIIIVALPTGAFGAIRKLTIKREWIPIETLKDNLFMKGIFRED
jgi:hypothetical protein